ncbi:MAG TPA: PAS domain S-box protein [Acidimicrobiales bacterium]|nr:PAS domain S-box protein [Acidimicrobiales bacterium]
MSACDDAGRRRAGEEQYAASIERHPRAVEHHRARSNRLAAIQDRWRSRSAFEARFGVVTAMADPTDADTIGDVGMAMVDAAPDALVMVSDGGQILVVNRQTERLFGYDREELLGQAVEVLVPERFRQVHRADRTRYRAEPAVRPMGPGVLLFGLRKDGAEFPVEISLSPFVTAAGLRVIAAVRDISERLVAEARAREVHRALDASADAVLLFDPDTLRLMYVNDGAVDQLGYSRDELLTMTQLHVKPEFTEARYRAMMAAVPPGQHHTYTTVHRRKDGTDVPVEAVLARPADDPAGEGWMISVARDLTNRLAAEERARAAERELALVDDHHRLARDLHDQVIQRLFAAGLGLSGMAAAADDPAQVERLTSVVDDLDETIRQLRTSIFNLTRPPAARTSLRAVVVDVCSQEREALGFDPALRFDGLIDTVGDAIAGEVAAVVREALSNIARHAGASRAEVALVATADGLTLRVVDDGVGLPVGRERAGNGLGNMAARAAALGGTCAIQAGAGDGTEVVWRVPL